MRRAVFPSHQTLSRSCAGIRKPLLRFLDMAFGSARELDYQLTLANQLGYIAQPKGTELAALSEESLKVLSGLIRSLRSDSRPLLLRLRTIGVVQKHSGLRSQASGLSNRNVRLGADSASKTDGRCSNHRIPAYMQAFDRCSSGGAGCPVNRQLAHCVPCTGSESDID
ncbi:MAG: four helix bundle protein [Pirellulaceae bacterium]